MGLGWISATEAWRPASHPAGPLFISVTDVPDSSKHTGIIPPLGPTTNLSISAPESLVKQLTWPGPALRFSPHAQCSSHSS